ncbi:MAG TPA: hypothetical protein VFZ24_05195 [Longimicrobiales bacterium]
MEHDGFMMGMMLGGALVALVPTGLVVGIAIHVVRRQRAQRREESEGTSTREVSP